MVDRIGKGGPPLPPAGPTGPAGAKETGKTFDVHKPEGVTGAQATRAGEVVATTGPTPLEQLKAGRIDLDGYLDLKVQEATAHLHGLSPVQLDGIRSMLRDRMATDPALADLVKQATGQAPHVPED
ncbi:MAG TPA: hypothetical protein VLM85_09740 [Polyangiaceae bacterium]|nr:hypothetical protein [Polyangiaceae bacterium]